MFPPDKMMTNVDSSLVARDISTILTTQQKILQRATQNLRSKRIYLVGDLFHNRLTTLFNISSMKKYTVSISSDKKIEARHYFLLASLAT